MSQANSRFKMLYATPQKYSADDSLHLHAPSDNTRCDEFGYKATKLLLEDEKVDGSCFVLLLLDWGENDHPFTLDSND